MVFQGLVCLAQAHHGNHSDLAHGHEYRDGISKIIGLTGPPS